jgi:hypothetical protein
MARDIIEKPARMIRCYGIIQGVREIDQIWGRRYASHVPEQTRWINDPHTGQDESQQQMELS